MIGEEHFGGLQEMLEGKGAELLVDTMEAFLEEEVRPRQKLLGVSVPYRTYLIDITCLPMDNEMTKQLFLKLFNERPF